MTNTRSFRTILMLTILALTFAFAQNVWVGDVFHNQDPFTGRTSCLQVSFNSLSDGTGVTFLTSNESEMVVDIRRALSSMSAAVFNMFGVLSGDLVYFLFSDGEVVTVSPDEVTVRTDRPYSESAYIENEGLVLRLLQERDEVRIRFASGRNQADFTVRAEVFEALREGFGQECLE